MEKYQKTTLILLSRDNKANCPIYEHQGKYYIKANKPNTSSFNPLYYQGTEYTEIEEIGNYWHTK